MSRGKCGEILIVILRNDSIEPYIPDPLSNGLNYQAPNAEVSQTDSFCRLRHIHIDVCIRKCLVGLILASLNPPHTEYFAVKLYLSRTAGGPQSPLGPSSQYL